MGNIAGRCFKLIELNRIISNGNPKQKFLLGITDIVLISYLYGTFLIILFSNYGN